jgi:hypothetical protein
MPGVCLRGFAIALCLALQTAALRDVARGYGSVAGVYFFRTYSTTFGILILDYDGTFAVLHQGCFGGGLVQRGTYRVDGSLVWFHALDGEIQPEFSVERKMHRVDKAGKRYLVGESDLGEVRSSAPSSPREEPYGLWYGDPSRAEEDLEFFRRLIPGSMVASR